MFLFAKSSCLNIYSWYLFTSPSAKATFDAISKTYSYLTPDLWKETVFTKSPYQVQYTAQTWFVMVFNMWGLCINGLFCFVLVPGVHWPSGQDSHQGVCAEGTGCPGSCYLLNILYRELLNKHSETPWDVFVLLSVLNSRQGCSVTLQGWECSEMSVTTIGKTVVFH